MNTSNEENINRVVTATQEDITEICSPFTGHCFEVAVSIADVFAKEQTTNTRFFEIHNEVEFTTQPTQYPSVIPQHIAVSIDGVLFDGAGKTTHGELLTEYVPWETTNAGEYAVWKDTFEHRNVIDESVRNKITSVYEETLRASE